MANPRRRLDTNVDGPFYVDDSCIDCGTCRWMAPDVFDRAEGMSRVHRQPTDSADALAALVACPTASIGSTESARGVRFPRPTSAPDVLHCGYHAESSFGAASWLLLRPDGNVLVDSPRFNRKLADALGELGVRWMFLTHRDDIADHARWAAELGCERLLHRADHRGQDIEHVFDGDLDLAPDLRILETPGHTRGSACLLAGDALFTGDHLAWSHRLGQLYAFRSACWDSWPRQIDSMKRLRRVAFRHVLPGHGAPAFDLPAGAIEACISWMEG